MLNPSKISVLLGTGLFVAACAMPAEDELATASAEERHEGQDDSLDVSGEPEAEDLATESSELTADGFHDDGADAQWRGGDRWRGGGGFSPGRPMRCDPRDAWHCRRGHRGWRWVTVPGAHGHGHDHGHGHFERGRRHHHHEERCCVRVGHRPHQPPRW